MDMDRYSRGSPLKYRGNENLLSAEVFYCSTRTLSFFHKTVKPMALRIQRLARSSMVEWLEGMILTNSVLS